MDVGCGVGVTPCYIASRHGCRVVGVDINEEMIERSRERAKRENLTDLVEFRVADAQDLPFNDDLFDVVIAESVTAFPDDKQKAVMEYARVTKPGGYVGLNEGTWLKIPPPPEKVAWAGQDLGANVKPLTSAEWVGLLEVASLSDVVVNTYEINTKEEAKGILGRNGRGGIIRIVKRMLALYVRNPAYRRFVKDVGRVGSRPRTSMSISGTEYTSGRSKGGRD